MHPTRTEFHSAFRWNSGSLQKKKEKKRNKKGKKKRSLHHHITPTYADDKSE
jgi:hypothetical protein